MTDRPVWGTKKHRAEDLVPGDVVRNSYGKWDVVDSITISKDTKYTSVHVEVGGTFQVRSVHLVDVQYAKPS